MLGYGGFVSNRVPSSLRAAPAPRPALNGVRGVRERAGGRPSVQGAHVTGGFANARSFITLRGVMQDLHRSVVSCGPRKLLCPIGGACRGKGEPLSSTRWVH